MTRYEEYLANAAECARIARLSRKDSDKATWDQMASSWKWKAALHVPQFSDLRLDPVSETRFLRGIR